MANREELSRLSVVQRDNTSSNTTRTEAVSTTRSRAIAIQHQRQVVSKHSKCCRNVQLLGRHERCHFAIGSTKEVSADREKLIVVNTGNQEFLGNRGCLIALGRRKTRRSTTSRSE